MAPRATGLIQEHGCRIEPALTEPHAVTGRPAVWDVPGFQDHARRKLRQDLLNSPLSPHEPRSDSSVRRHLRVTLKSLHDAGLLRDDRLAPDATIPYLTDSDLMGNPYQECVRMLVAHASSQGSIRIISTAVQVGAYAAFRTMRRWGVDLYVSHADLHGVEQMRNLVFHVDGSPPPFAASSNDAQHLAIGALAQEYKYLVPTMWTEQRLLHPNGVTSKHAERIYFIELSSLDAALRRHRTVSWLRNAKPVPGGLAELVDAARHLGDNELITGYSPVMEQVLRRLRRSVGAVPNWCDIAHYGLYVHDSWLRDARLRHVAAAFEKVFVAAWSHCARNWQKAFDEEIWPDHVFLSHFALASGFCCERILRQTR